MRKTEKRFINVRSLANFISHIVRDIKHSYDSLGLHDLNKDQYHFIPSYEGYLTDLAYILNKCKIKKTDKIVDAGCGVSPILMFLHLLGYTKLTGIEIHNFYLNKLRTYTYGLTLINGDILEQDYKTYKVIYSYVPIRNTVLCKKFYKRVLETMKPGAILVDFSGPIRDLKLTEIKGNFERKEKYIIKL